MGQPTPTPTVPGYSFYICLLAFTLVLGVTIGFGIFTALWTIKRQNDMIATEEHVAEAKAMGEHPGWGGRMIGIEFIGIGFRYLFLTPPIAAAEISTAAATAAFRTTACQRTTYRNIGTIEVSEISEFGFSPYLTKHSHRIESIEALECARELGRLLRDAGEADEAEALLREALTVGGDALGPRHRTTLLAASGLGALLQAQGRLEEAERLHAEALGGFREVFGPWHPATEQAAEDLQATRRLRAERSTGAPARRRSSSPSAGGAPSGPAGGGSVSAARGLARGAEQQL
ncbi:unnamed protein product [Prorocentrum cordatum]|uniref:Tetratricopeptide repeat protein n=1 Tax=Prorocentrum cordatum TaxID=2364126 RepID=A0ABN9RCP6_9DINO|nr:unnamed protein product [Polarella glacialis]